MSTCYFSIQTSALYTNDTNLSEFLTASRPVTHNSACGYQPRYTWFASRIMGINTTCSAQEENFAYEETSTIYGRQGVERRHRVE